MPGNPMVKLWTAECTCVGHARHDTSLPTRYASHDNCLATAWQLNALWNRGGVPPNASTSLESFYAIPTLVRRRYVPR